MPFQLQLDGAERQGPRGERRVMVKVPGGGECSILALDWNHGSQLVQSLTEMPVKSSLGPQRGLLAPNLILFVETWKWGCQGIGEGKEGLALQGWHCDQNYIPIAQK